MMKFFQLQPPKLLYLSPVDAETSVVEDEGDIQKGPLDQTDRLPVELKVSWFDMFCFIFSMTTYLLDIITDLIVAYVHYRFGRYTASALIFTLAVIPTMLLNIVSLLWWIDDSVLARKSESDRSSTKVSHIVCVTMHILQLGPLVWYARALRAGIKFWKSSQGREKLKFYCDMVAADRDASLLRFFEAFIESMPQVLVQGYVFLGLYNGLKDGERLVFMAYIQILSTFCSLVSSCWSIIVQHRTLRIARQDKPNMTVLQTCLQFVWRFFTICSRYISLVVFAVVFDYWIFLVLSIHFSLSVLHITALQLPSIKGDEKSVIIRFGLIVVSAAVHLFTPFNMAEGSTKWRYLCAYTLEVLEYMVLFALVFNRGSFSCQLGVIAATTGGVSFVVGISIMVLYYTRFHFKWQKTTQRNSKLKGALRSNVMGDSQNSLRHIDSDPEL